MIINIFDLIFKSNIFMMSLHCIYHIVKSKIRISKVLAIYNFKIMHHCDAYEIIAMICTISAYVDD